MGQTQTELHTHLIGMLSAEGFIDFIVDHVSNIYWPLNKPVGMKTKIIKSYFLKDRLLMRSKALNDLSIARGHRTKYEMLNSLYHTRTQILNFIAETHPDYDENNRWAVKGRIYNDYINACLKELVDQGVKYVEISYSIRQAIMNFEIDEDLKDKIYCKFLVSTDRSNPISKVRETCNDMKKLMNKGLAVGFDFMGLEQPFSKEEKNNNDDSNTTRSFKQKLEIVLKTLNSQSNTTLRIHAGETPESENNPEIVLGLIEDIAHEQKIDIPPPFIRIGHGVYFKNNSNYLRLLKKLYCIVEINASSNYALGNIQDFNDLPYQYYIKNQIPIVVSTDGHGLYSTKIAREDLIARSFMTEKQFEMICKIDQTILDSKL